VSEIVTVPVLLSCTLAEPIQLWDAAGRGKDFVVGRLIVE
jgi:hypothetical protein